MTKKEARAVKKIHKALAKAGLSNLPAVFLRFAKAWKGELAVCDRNVPITVRCPTACVGPDVEVKLDLTVEDFFQAALLADWMALLAEE